MSEIQVYEVEDPQGYVGIAIHVWLKRDEFPALLIEADPDTLTTPDLVPALLCASPASGT